MILMKMISTLLMVLGCVAIGISQPNVKDETAAMSTEVVGLYNAGKLNEAQEKAKQVITIREKRDGRQHLGLAPAWRNLAYVEMARKDLKAAEAAFDRTLDILGSNKPLSTRDETMLAEILETAAYFDIRNGTLGKSESRLKRAVEIRERLEGPSSKKLADPLRMLGRMHYARGEYDTAIPILVRALELKYDQAGVLADDDLVLRETAMCSLRKAGRISEADEVGKKFKSSTAGGQDIPKDKTISAGVVNGKALTLAKPAYPREARAKGDDGIVSVQVLIDEAGAVIFACAVSGAKTLQAVSEDAAYRSSFSPTRLKGEPVKVSGVITYNFRY